MDLHGTSSASPPGPSGRGPPAASRGHHRHHLEVVCRTAGSSEWGFEASDTSWLKRWCRSEGHRALQRRRKEEGEACNAYGPRPHHCQHGLSQYSYASSPAPASSPADHAKHPGQPPKPRRRAVLSFSADVLARRAARACGCECGGAWEAARGHVQRHLLRRVRPEPRPVESPRWPRLAPPGLTMHIRLGRRRLSTPMQLRAPSAEGRRGTTSTGGH